MTDSYDMVVVGAGLVGLAFTMSLLEERPTLRIAVIDKESSVACHQSGHNSGVLHSGLYYAPGSLKATLCLEGKARVEAFADAHGLPFERCGKLVVALDETELGRLAELKRRGEANGVPGIKELGPDELREVEPHVAGLRALHVPGTAIIDFSRVARAYADDIQAGGATLLLGRRFITMARRGVECVVRTNAGEIRSRNVVTCAGLYSDRCAAVSGDTTDLRIVPFRGDYYTLIPSARSLVRGLIYPVPDPALPFLGVHFTRRIDGQVWAGPNAVLAWAREGYKRSTVRLSELAAILGFPGFWRMGGRYWRTGAAEMWRDLVKKSYVRQLQRYIPAIRGRDLIFGPSGVRAQALRRDGSLVDDFVIAHGPRVMHVINAPSPAATASLAIGRSLALQAIQRFEL